jgi:membrane protein implicated in regulation of membrane protease activity
VGKTAIELERVSNDEAVGVVRLEGEVWTARAFDEDRVIDAGEKVHVIEIRGATAMVD